MSFSFRSRSISKVREAAQSIAKEEFETSRNKAFEGTLPTTPTILAPIKTDSPLEIVKNSSPKNNVTKKLNNRTICFRNIENKTP